MSGLLTTNYEASHALVVGIDEYEHSSPLGYAKSDAKAIASCLIDTFDFPADNVRLLLDEEATKKGIFDAFMEFTADTVLSNDRIVFFYAGHGHTVRSNRGDIGYLIPHDGNTEQLGTLLRWDDLTRNADLIAAKHVLFIMDACYGGLAITRSMQPGATRFLRDMLRRNARQVITAGKADEVVADEGGPRPDHSVFTGHLLDALEGKAVNETEPLTANTVMHYVYRMVGSDAESSQTPHYGYLDGDGDFVLRFPKSEVSQENAGSGEAETDVLVSVQSAVGQAPVESNRDKVKRLLSDERQRIALHDVIAEETRAMIAYAESPPLQPQGSWSEEAFTERLKAYESAVSRLMEVQALVCYWGQPCHKDSISFAISRYVSTIGVVGGLSSWLALRWYPVNLMVYSGGIAAIAATNYDSLAVLLNTSIPDEIQRRQRGTVVADLPGRMIELIDAFKTLPNRNRQYTPISEYLHTFLQPTLDDLLFLGGDYERYFDRFELMYALEHIAQSNGGWAPAGRFGWKRHRDPDIVQSLTIEAEKSGDDWPPFAAGMFGGSHDSFKKCMATLEEHLGRLNWF